MANSNKLILIVAITIFLDGKNTRACNSMGRWSVEVASGGVEFFTESQFRGYSYIDNYTPGCHEIPAFFRKNIRSLKLNGKKIRIFKNSGCTGPNIGFGEYSLTCDLVYDGHSLYCKYMIGLGSNQERDFIDQFVSWMPDTDADGRLIVGYFNSFNGKDSTAVQKYKFSS